MRKETWDYKVGYLKSKHRLHVLNLWKEKGEKEKKTF